MPVELSGTTVIGYFDYSRHYSKTCGYIAAEIMYHSNDMILYFIPPTGEQVEKLKGSELIDGDSFINLHYNVEKFNELVGTLEEMKEKLRERGIQVGGGKTRKGKRSKRRATRKHK